MGMGRSMRDPTFLLVSGAIVTMTRSAGKVE